MRVLKRASCNKGSSKGCFDKGCDRVLGWGGPVGPSLTATLQGPLFEGLTQGRSRY